jgi:3'-phosphoadenosine 5'-phosphosulfate (PAPS) 3'-phosphatase
MIGNTSTKIKSSRLISLMIHFFGKVDKLFQQIKNEEFKVNVHYKHKNEKFTEADWIIQKMFENYMSNYFPAVKIMGEEDTSVEIVKESEYFKVENENEINFELISESTISTEFDLSKVANTTDINSISSSDQNELSVFIDPIDSTDQFIKKNFGPVTVLVGFCLNSQPYLGFIHYPCNEGSNKSLTYFNIPGKGVYTYNSQKNELAQAEIKKEDSDDWTFISSGSKTTDKMRDFYKLFPNSKNLNVHGLGNKSAKVIMYDYVYLASGAGTIHLILIYFRSRILGHLRTTLHCQRNWWRVLLP